MKRIVSLVLCLWTAGLLFAQDSLVRGGFIEYTYLGNHSYEAELSLYLTCSNTEILPYIGCKVGNDTLSGDTLVFIRETDVTGIPPHCSIQSSCSGDTAAIYGVKRIIWKRRFDLDTFSHCSVRFFAVAAKRDAGVTTGSAGQVFYIDSWLNQCLAAGSSSPGMTSPNESYLLLRNEDVFLDYGLTGYGSFDSASFEAAAGRISENGNMTYNVYTPSRPVCYFGFSPSWGFPNNNLQWPAGFHLDPLNGQVAFRPGSICFAPIVLKITLWKRGSNGQQIASVLYREHAVQIVQANNHIPKILPPFSAQVCAGQKHCFSIVTDDDDTGDSVFLSINSDLPGLTYQINHSQSPYARAEVCWTPDSSFISNIPYTFTVKAKDNYCNLPGTNVRAFSMFVRETPKAQTAIQVQNCGRVILTGVPEKSYTGMHTSWKVWDSLGNTVFSSNRAIDTFLVRGGKYRTAFSISTSTPCTQTYYDSFVVAPYNELDLAVDTLYCFGDTIRVKALNSENHNFTYDWFNPQDSSVQSFQQDQVYYLADSSHYLYLTVKWDDYCQVSDSSLIRVWHPRRELPLSVPAICADDSTSLAILDPKAGYDYQWSTGEQSDSIVVTPGWYFLNTTYFAGCEFRDSLEVKANPLPDITLSVPDTLCPGDTTVVTAFVIASHPVSYLWQDSSTKSSVTSTGGWSVLQVIDANACRSSDSIFTANYELPEPDSNRYTVCYGQGFHLFSGDTTGMQIHYSFGDSGNYVLPDSGGAAVAFVTTREGCRVDYPFDIVVNELPDPSFTFSTLMDRNVLFIPTHQWNAFHSWDFGDGTTSGQMVVSHAYNANGPYSVRLLVTDRSTGCLDSSTLQVMFHVGLENTGNVELLAFPNPFKKVLQLQSPLAGTYRIYSATGSLVWEGEIGADEQQELDTRNWKPGVYFLYLDSGGKHYAGKLVREAD